MDKTTITNTCTNIYTLKGTYSAKVKVIDNDGVSAEATIIIAVAQSSTQNHVPTANNESLTIDENKIANITLTGTDFDGAVLTYIIVSEPSNSTLSGTAPYVIYTPNTGFTGTDKFTFKVNDGKADSNNAKVSIIINSRTSATGSGSDSKKKGACFISIILNSTNQADKIKILNRLCDKYSYETFVKYFIEIYYKICVLIR
ncbi:Ig-like domain-containing protein [Candidatus Desantisbacteria bacterium]|nr:Ig-like domain-containing protein [Candidatus Desantisbacteria bacterium]